MTKTYGARVSVLLALTAFAVNALSACVDDRNVGLAPDSSAGTSGSGGAAPAGGTSGGGGTAGNGGTAGSDASLTGGTSGEAGSDGGSQDSSPEAGVELDQFCGLLLSEVCTWVKGCRQFPKCEDWPMYPRIQATCLAGPAAVAAGRLRYHPVEGKACLDAVSGSSAAADAGPCQRRGGSVVVDSLNFGHGSCARAFTGLVPAGGECYSDSSLGGSECAGGVCYRSAGACPGKCVAYRKATQSCGAPGEYCDPETFCNVNVCETRRGTNAQCDDDNHCQPGLTCVPAADAGPLKKCGTLGTEGDPCEIYESCGSRECHLGKCRLEVPSGAPCHSDFACPDNEVCVLGSPLAKVGVCKQGVPVGTACGKDTDCQGYQPLTASGPTCKSSDGAMAPVCTVPAGLLQACGYRPCNPGPCDYLACADGMYCDTFSGGAPVCRNLVQSGGTCTQPQQCAPGLLCMSGTTCRAPGALSEPCSPENYAPPSCQAGLHCDWTSRTCAAPRPPQQQYCTPRWPNSCHPEYYCACPEPTCNSFDWNNPEQTWCEPKRHDGATCQAPFQCLGGYCNSGKCARYPQFTFCDGIDDGPDGGPSEAG